MDEQNNNFQSPVQPQQPMSGSVVQPQQPFASQPVQPQQPFGAQPQQPQQPVAQPQGFGAQPQAQPQQPFASQPAQPQQPFASQSGQPQGFGGQPATPPPGYVPNAQPAYGAAVKPPANTGKATGALVCGIAAIAICFLVPIIGAPVGLILGIVAIVLGGSFIKQFGPFGRAKAGRICGIIGVVLSTLSLVLAIAVTVFAAVVGYNLIEDADIYFDDYAIVDIYTEEPAMAPLDQAAAERAVTEAVSAQFDLLAEGEVGMLALVGDVANQGFNEATGLTLEDCGVNPEDYAAAITEGLKYTVNEISFYDSASGYAGVYVTCKDIFEVYNIFYEDMDAFSASAEAQAMTDDEFNARVGEILMAAIDKAPITQDVNWAIIDVELIDGEWSINQETWEFEMDYMFSLV